MLALFLSKLLSLGLCPRKPSCTHLLGSIPWGYDGHSIGIQRALPSPSSCTDCSRGPREVTSLLGLSHLWDGVADRPGSPPVMSPPPRRGPSPRALTRPVAWWGPRVDLVLLARFRSPARSSAASPASVMRLPQGLGACSACRLWSWGPSPGSCPVAGRPPPPAAAVGGQWLEHLPWRRPDPVPCPRFGGAKRDLPEVSITAGLL